MSQNYLSIFIVIPHLLLFCIQTIFHRSLICINKILLREMFSYLETRKRMTTYLFLSHSKELMALSKDYLTKQRFLLLLDLLFTLDQGLLDSIKLGFRFLSGIKVTLMVMVPLPIMPCRTLTSLHLLANSFPLSFYRITIYLGYFEFSHEPALYLHGSLNNKLRNP